MKKSMGLMALGLSMALLSGCGSSDDIVNDIVDDIVEDTEVLNTPAVVEKNIVGTWSVGCVNDDDGSSESDIVILNADGTGGFEGAEYTAPDCNEADEGESWTGSFTYEVGEATVGSNDEAAVELNLEVTEDGVTGPYYTMVRFTTADTWLMADDGDENADADTPETREDIFEGNEDYVYTRQ